MNETGKIYPGTNDVVFKILFVNHKNYLRSLLSAFLEMPEDDIFDIDIRNPDIPPNYIKEKFSRLDIHSSLKIRNEIKIVNIEMQNLSEDYYAERTLYCWSDIFKTSLDSGMSYDEVPVCVALGVLNFRLFRDEEDSERVHSRFRIYRDDGKKLLTDKLDIHFIELPKVKALDENETDMKKLWAKLLRARTKEEFDMIEQRTSSSIIRDASRSIQEISADEKNWHILRQREKAEHDAISALKYAKREGKAEGKAEGRAEGRAEERKALIAKFRAAGVTDEVIQSVLNMQ